MADLVRARVTVHLPGAAPGQVRLVDPGDTYIALCLKSGALVLETEALPDDEASSGEAYTGDA